jgi:hydrogenase nickel incorporation protein HypB
MIKTSMNTTATRLIPIRARLLSRNDAAAHQLRQRFRAAGVRVSNWVSSPGSGKTALLERVLRNLTAHGVRAAALVGDLETDNDARRLARSGARVHQIQTHGYCHLEAEWVAAHIAQAGWDLATLDFLFIENVGNLVCPASYDLGEDLRVVLLAVTEGEDKPLKYPGMFSRAGAAVITKMDLAVACGCDLNLLRQNILAVQPEMRIYETSAQTGHGVRRLIDDLIIARVPHPSQERTPCA